MSGATTPALPIVAALLAGLFPVTSPWPAGNMLPQSACYKDMKPKSVVGAVGMEGHLLRPQNERLGKKPFLPYYILHDQATYSANSETVVTVVANQTKSLMFYKGLLLQARAVVCASDNNIEVGDTPLGSWIVKSIPDKPVHLLSTMDCTGTNSKSAVRHRTPAMKIREVVTWKAPPEPAGHIVFWATIVQQGNIHWTGVHSSLLLDPRGGKPPSCGAGAISATLLSTLTLALTALLTPSYRFP